MENEYIDKVYIDRPCPVSKALEMIDGKWKILILYNLSQRDYRYNELKRVVFGVTNNSLTRALNELQEVGFIDRIEYDEKSPHVLYRLTDFGKTLLPILEKIREWYDVYILD